MKALYITDCEFMRPSFNPYNMIAYKIILFIVGVQMISAQDENIPEKCLRPPNIKRPHNCCNPPPIFAEEDMAECGMKKPGEDELFDPSDCSKQQCLLKKFNLMTDDKINVNAMKDFIDAYTAKNEDMKPVAEEAKGCLKDDLPGPPQICLPNRIMFCVGMTMTQKCPEKFWEQSDDCKILKDHLDECKPYFEKRRNKFI